MNRITTTALIAAADAGAAPTLDWLIKRLQGAEGVSSRRRRDWLSAVRSFCAIIGKRPDQVLAATQAIRTHLAQVTPASAGISAKRLQNIKSDLLAALRYFGITKFSLTPGFVPMSLGWERLWVQIQNEQIRFKLSRLFRFASARQIQPSQMTDALLRDLLLVLTSSSLICNPVGHVRGAIGAWNRCMRECAGWPQITLQKVGAGPYKWGLPLERFPTGFRSDIDVWIKRLEGDDLLAEDGPLRPLAAATLRHRRQQARIVASAAVCAGVPTELFQSLAPLADPEVLAKARVVFTMGSASYCFRNRPVVTAELLH